MSTKTTFKGIKDQAGDNYSETLEKWNKLKKQGEHVSSPKSSSEYVVTNEGVYRLSDHWGRAASCDWEISGDISDNSWNIGFSKFSDFKINNESSKFSVFNKKYGDSAPVLLKEAIQKLESLKDFELTKTQEKEVNRNIDLYKYNLDSIKELIKNKGVDEIVKSIDIDEFIADNNTSTSKLYADCILTNKFGKILFLKRSWSDSFGAWEYGLPGGTVEVGESIKDALIREVKEETSIDVKNAFFLKEYDNGNNTKSFYFISNEGDSGFIVLDNSEHDNYIWVNKEEAQELQMIGELKQRINEML